MLTEEMRGAALDAWRKNTGSRMDQINAALEAVAPRVRNATLEEAAKRVELFSSDGRYADKHDTMLCEHLASAIRALATHSGDGEGK